MRRQLQADLATVESQLALLASVQGKLAAPTLHERFGWAADLGTAGLLGGLYGYGRAYLRARWRDITPSTARELGSYVGRRTALGVVLLLGLQEALGHAKRDRYADVLGGIGKLGAALGLGGGGGGAAEKAGAGREGGGSTAAGVAGYSQEGLQALVAIDLANIAVLGVVSFCFPYIIVPSLLQPLQFLLPPSSPAFPMPKARAAGA